MRHPVRGRAEEADGGAGVRGGRLPAAQVGQHERGRRRAGQRGGAREQGVEVLAAAVALVPPRDEGAGAGRPGDEGLVLAADGAHQAHPARGDGVRVGPRAEHPDDGLGGAEGVGDVAGRAHPGGPGADGVVVAGDDHRGARGHGAPGAGAPRELAGEGDLGELLGAQADGGEQLGVEGRLQGPAGGRQPVGHGPPCEGVVGDEPAGEGERDEVRGTGPAAHPRPPGGLPLAQVCPRGERRLAARAHAGLPEQRGGPERGRERPRLVGGAVGVPAQEVADRGVVLVQRHAGLRHRGDAHGDDIVVACDVRDEREGGADQRRASVGRGRRGPPDDAHGRVAVGEVDEHGLDVRAPDVDAEAPHDLSLFTIEHLRKRVSAR
nr:hypothetical protein [Georgenia faecalis]